MHFKNDESKEAFAEAVKVNDDDDYSAAIVSYTRDWAELMETQMQKNDLADIWKQASHDANTYGVSGFMYGAAASMISEWWIHGEKFRTLYNGDYGVTSDKGTVNPAIITFEI